VYILHADFPDLYIFITRLSPLSRVNNHWRTKMAMEQTLILVKPDGLVKSLTGNIIARLSEAKLIIIGAKMAVVNRELAVKHYEHLRTGRFSASLSITSWVRSIM